MPISTASSSFRAGPDCPSAGRQWGYSRVPGRDAGRALRARGPTARQRLFRQRGRRIVRGPTVRRVCSTRGISPRSGVVLLQERFRGARAAHHYRWPFVPHHLAHAASAFHPSPFDHAAVMTLDGRGERATTGHAVGRGTDLEWLGQVQIPHSLGIVHEHVTTYLGFLHSSDEYKVMALASYGKPRHLDQLRDLVRLGEAVHNRRASLRGAVRARAAPRRAARTAAFRRRPLAPGGPGGDGPRTRVLAP